MFGLVRPDDLLAPVRRRLRHRSAACAERPCFGSRTGTIDTAVAAWRTGSSDDAARRVVARRCRRRAVRVDRRVAPVGRRSGRARTHLSSAQSHCVMTTLRSTPCGRGGAGGTSPGGDAIGPVREHRQRARAAELRVSRAVHLRARWPDCTRWSHAAADESNVPRLGGISRVAFVPSWWHCCTRSSSGPIQSRLRLHRLRRCRCRRCRCRGTRSSAGTCSSEYQ